MSVLDHHKLAVATLHSDALNFPGVDATRLTLCALDHQVQPCDLDQALHKVISDALASGAGWCRFRSEIGATGGPVPEFAVSGPPLQAEWVIGPDTSCKLWPDPSRPGGGLLWTIHERAVTSTAKLQPGERLCLRTVSRGLTRAGQGPGGRTIHHVFWRAGDDEDPHQMRRLSDRFVGFEPSKKVAADAR